MFTGPSAVRSVLLAIVFSVPVFNPQPVYAATRPNVSDGRSLFVACEYKQAARAFANALAKEPGNAELSFWLGKSYARQAEVSTPFSASRYARTARLYLEQAVVSDPQNNEYLGELFSFYVESPAWFRGGLARAEQLAERMGPGDDGRFTAIEMSRRDHSGPCWWIQRGFLRSSDAIGKLGRGR